MEQEVELAAKVLAAAFRGGNQPQFINRTKLFAAAIETEGGP